MEAAQGVCLHHIARETPDVSRLTKFYQEILGFEQVENPNFGNVQVVWLRLPPLFTLHLIQKNPESKLPETPWNCSSSVIDPQYLPTSHHLCFSISNYESFVRGLKEKGIKTFEKTQPDGKTKQAFFFDPDGNGLEVGNWKPAMQ